MSRYSLNFDELVSKSTPSTSITSGSREKEKPAGFLASPAFFSSWAAARATPPRASAAAASRMMRVVARARAVAFSRLMAAPLVREVRARRRVAAVDRGVAIEAGAVEDAVRG